MSAAKERILKTASQLFYQEGIRATGVDRIIAEAQVTKVTFYRHFPSKNDLILEFLNQRHESWTTWFKDSLSRHGSTLRALPLVLAEWIDGKGPDRHFRGCAFINSVAEIGESSPEVIRLARRHKEDLVQIIADTLPAARNRNAKAEMISLAFDGAISRAQVMDNSKRVVGLLTSALRALE